MNEVLQALWRYIFGRGRSQTFLNAFTPLTALQGETHRCRVPVEWQSGRACLHMQNRRNATEDICCSDGDSAIAGTGTANSAWEFGLRKAYRKSLISKSVWASSCRQVNCSLRHHLVGSSAGGCWWHSWAVTSSLCGGVSSLWPDCRRPAWDGAVGQLTPFTPLFPTHPGTDPARQVANND